MTASRPISGRPHLYYAALCLLASLLLGGGTAQALWSDHVVQLIMLPAVFLGLRGLADRRVAVPARVLVVLLLLICAAQFLPISNPAHSPTGPSSALLPSPRFLSMDAGRSLAAATHAMTLAGFFLYVARMAPSLQLRLLHIILMGVLGNLVVVLLQLFHAGGGDEPFLLPFEPKAGAFANANHLAAVFSMTVPIVAYLLLPRAAGWLGYLVCVGLCLLVLLAVDAMAGIAVVSGVGVFCLVWMRKGHDNGPWAAALRALLLLVMVIAYVPLVLPDLLGEEYRARIFATSWQVVEAWLPLGSGLGTFESVYTRFDADAPVRNTVVNHAHNDVLELLIELGLLAVPLVALLLWIVWAPGARSPFADIARISLVACIMHTSVDYPLRTMAAGALFAFLLGVRATREVEERRLDGNGRESFVEPALYLSPAGLDDLVGGTRQGRMEPVARR